MMKSANEILKAIIEAKNDAEIRSMKHLRDKLVDVKDEIKEVKWTTDKGEI